MNRFNTSRHLAALAAVGLAGAIALTGCSSGQLSQTASQASAVDGSEATIQNVALRNIRIQATQTGDFLRPGQSVELVLVASNQSPDSADKLVRITSDIGPVTLSGDATLPVGGVLFVGTADGQNSKAVAKVKAAKTAKATVALDKPISNGLTYNFTFDFENAGRTTVGVPISAGLAKQKSETPAPAQHP